MLETFLLHSSYIFDVLACFDVQEHFCVFHTVAGDKEFLFWPLRQGCLLDFGFTPELHESGEVCQNSEVSLPHTAVCLSLSHSLLFVFKVVCC